MNNLESDIQKITSRIFDAEAGIVRGWTCGIKPLDDKAGRMCPGQLWIVGGASGSGKSYFVSNMIEGIIKEWEANTKKEYIPPKIAVFSTELTSDIYVERHVHLRAGVYPMQVVNQPERFADKVRSELERYHAERSLNPGSLTIHGEIGSIEQIEKILNESIVDMPNIVFVDYVQELTANGRSDPKDTMPIIANKLKTIAIKHKVVVVAVSQINNYVFQAGANPLKSHVSPFSYGKELTQAAHTAIFIWREKDPETGVLSSDLIAGIIKSRGGMTGSINLNIQDGFRLYYYGNNQQPQPKAS